MQSNNMPDDHAIPDQDYVNFINQLREVGKAYENFMDQVREVGKADFLEPNLARSQQAEVSTSQLEDGAIDYKKKRKLNNGYDANANHPISDPDYTQFCNHLREGVNSTIQDFGSNAHKRVSAAATMEGVTVDREISDEKDSNNTYDDCSIPDPGYLLFLDHLREDGNSYFLELVDDQNGASKIFRYEEEEEEEEEEEKEGMMSKPKKQRTSQDTLNKISCHREKPNYGTNHNVTAPEPIPDALPVLDSHVSPGCLDVDASYQKYLNHLKLVDGDLVFDMKSAALESASDVPPISTKHKNTECSNVDVAYQEFLNRIRLQDGFMVLDLKSGASIIYEKEPSEAFNGFTGLQKASACSVDHSLMPYEIGRLDSGSQFKVCGRNTSDPLDSFHYGKKLTDFISRPYDQNEYEELLEEATVRKPLCRQKHLRNMSKVYATNLKGMSYLDHHPHLAKLLQEADNEKRLMLLRGFFFWLQNLCHDGAFRPWMPLQARNYPTDNNEGCLSDDDVRLIE